MLFAGKVLLLLLHGKEDTGQGTGDYHSPHHSTGNPLYAKNL